MVRELTETEKARGYTSVVHIRPADPTIGRGGVEVVDPRTGQSRGTIGRIEYSRRQRGQRKFRGELFVSAPARPEVERKIRKREEIRYEIELAEKRAEVARKKEPRIREKEFLVREIREGKPIGEFKSRKALRGLVDIREERRAEQRVPLRISPLRRPRVELEAIKTPITPSAIAKEKAKVEKARLVGEIRAAPPTPWYEKPTIFAERLEFKARKKGIRKVPYIAGAVGLGAVGYTIGLGRAALHPIRTVRGLGYAITHPFETGARAKERLITRPATTLGEVGAMVALPFAVKAGIKGVRKITPKKYIPEKLVEARARITYPEKGKPIQAWELKVEKGKPIRAIRPPKVKPARVAFKGELFVERKPTVAAIYERVGVAKISIPKKAKVPTIEIIKRDIRLKKISIGKPVKLPTKPTFPKAKPYRELVRVKGFEKLQIRSTELISIEPPKIKRYPFVTAKKIKVEPTIRKGAEITPRYLRTEVPKGVVPKAYEELIFVPTKRPYVRKPTKLPPVPKKPKLIDITKQIELRTEVPKKVSYVTAREKIKRIDIGMLRIKEITRPKIVEIALGIPKARQIALQRLREITKPVVAKVRKVKPVIRYRKVVTPLEKVVGRIAKKRLPFVPPPEYLRPVTVPTAPELIQEAIPRIRPTIQIQRVALIKKIEPMRITPIRRLVPITKPRRVTRLMEVPPITIPTVKPMVAQEVPPITKQDVALATIPIVEAIPKYKAPRVPIYPKLIPPREFAAPFIPIIPPRLYFFEKIRKAKKIKPRKFEYAPSLPAVGQWWIKIGKRPSPKQIITPISPRPIFVPTKKLRKRLRETGMLGSLYR